MSQDVGKTQVSDYTGSTVHVFDFISSATVNMVQFFCLLLDTCIIIWPEKKSYDLTSIRFVILLSSDSLIL